MKIIEDHLNFIKQTYKAGAAEPSPELVQARDEVIYLQYVVVEAQKEIAVRKEEVKRIRAERDSFPTTIEGVVNRARLDEELQEAKERANVSTLEAFKAGITDQGVLQVVVDRFADETVEEQLTATQELVAQLKNAVNPETVMANYFEKMKYFIDIESG